MSLVNAACTECGEPPTESADVAVVATPAPSTATGLPATPSIVNTTEPVGVPAPELTVAENVTLEPNTDGLLSEDTTVELEAAVTV